MTYLLSAIVRKRLQRRLPALALVLFFISACSAYGEVTKGFNSSLGKIDKCEFSGFGSPIRSDVIVTGKVLDEIGQPMIGATIKIKGLTIATATDVNGTFSINAPENAVLIVTTLGYETQEVTAAGSKALVIKMVPSSKSLNEVVVIGYGTQKKSSVTGSISTLKNENFDERPITRVDQALVGQLAGVDVKQTTGVPGKPFSIQVRGVASISAGTEPLYVIDGFPLTPNSSNVQSGSYSSGNPLDNINPSDIENIEVLKDAAAAAIYGSRASNGVVLITTKRGKTGAPKVSFNASYGYNAASKVLPELNEDQWIARAIEIINATYVVQAGKYGATADDDATTRRAKLTLSGVPLSGSQINANYMLDPRWAIPGHQGLEYVNWQKEIERKGLMQTEELNVTGGSDAVKYYISGGYQNQDGFIKEVGYKQYNLRANVEANISKKFKVGVNIAPSYSISQDPGVEGKGSVFNNALSDTPVLDDTLGLYPAYKSNGFGTWAGSGTSPVGLLQSLVGTTKKYRTIASTYGEYEIFKGLIFKTTVNLDNVDGETNTYTPYYVGGTQASRIFTGSNNLLLNTSGTFGQYQRQTFVNENTLNYTTTFKSVHTLNVLLGQSYNSDRLDLQSEKSVGGYTNATVQSLSAAASTSANSSSTKSILESYFARVQYSYKDKYLLLASIRTDGSSRFGPDNKWGVFPAASAAWRITQEDFMKNLSAVSDLKLRISYGVNGNSNIGDYGSIPQVGSANIVTGGTKAATIGQAPILLANPTLKWEKSQTYDAGLDFGFFNNRLTGSFDYYNKLSNNLLLYVAVPEISGFGSYLNNIGSMRDVGEELELTSRNTIGKFQWSTTLNVSHNDNKILSLGAGQSQIIIPNGLNVSDAILRVGEPLNSIYVLKYNGFLTASDIAAKVPMYSNEQAGDPKFIDANHDGVISEADKQIVGHPNANYLIGITNTFRYKHFDLSILVQGQTGGSLYSELARSIARAGDGYTVNVPAAQVDRWYSETNPGAGRFGKAYSTFNSPITAMQDAVYSTDYYRIRNITLGYDLKSVIKTPLIGAARIYVSMENFFGGDKYTGGLNPEATNIAVSSDSNYPETGDYGGLPLAKSLVFGLNFTF